MKITRLIAIAVIAGSVVTGFCANTAQAQDAYQQPLEFPPSSYKGKQYVDSRGCVFIRAGIDGNVTWVPRVSRARKTVCGFKPSLAGQVGTAAPAAAPAEAPVQITLNDTASPVAPSAPVAKPAAPRRVAAPRPAPAPVVVRQTAPRPAPKAAPVRVVAPAPAPRVRTVLPQQAAATACPGASPLSQQYLRGNGRNAVRCGPQTAPIVGARLATVAPSAQGTATYDEAGPAPTATVTANTRIVPKHVAYGRINTRNVVVPSGYRRVWEDGRLNPYRAEQTLGGRRDMLLIWTQTVPRRLIDTRTGRDMTTSVPLVYPFIDVVTQSRELGKVEIVQRDGTVLKRIVRNPGVAPVTRQPVYSSRSTPQAAEPQAALPMRALEGARFVQVGTFGNPSNAQRAAQKIAAMGMPARLGKLTKGGRTLLTVQAGPLDGTAALQSAVSRLRAAGYRDAFARK